MIYEYRRMGRLIRQLRLEKGISQEVLSGLAGIGRTHLTMIENGQKNASIDTLMKIAHAMDMKMSELFSRYETMQL